jgi:hypothetical protein
VFALLALFIARPAALRLAFLRSRLSAREQLAAVWFGPKGLRLRRLRPTRAPDIVVARAFDEFHDTRRPLIGIMRVIFDHLRSGVPHNA